jgi:integrase/recombinase XerD
VSKLCWRDVDFGQELVTFSEKGGKTITKPMPATYRAILRAAAEAGAVDSAPASYVVPMERPQRRRGERDDRIIWRIIKRLGKRAGVEVFPHALRHAFSVRFLEQHPGEIEALQRLLGHSKLETTQRYLRAMEQGRLMERVRDLSWDLPFEAIAEEAPSGIEPLYEALQASA